MPGEIMDTTNHEPLDRRLTKVTKNGVVKDVPALHCGWAEKGLEFALYSPPPTEMSIKKSRDNCQILPELQKEWVDKMTFLLQDLKWLLQLPHHRFWSQVVYDQSVHDCLESFLTQAPRYFDPVDTSLTEKIQELLQELYKRVFCVYLRMGTYKESKEYHITPQVFGEILYENFIFDLPKLMDLCVIYYHGNSTLLSKLISNIFKNQPKYEDDLLESVTTVLHSLENVCCQLGIQVDEEASQSVKLLSDGFVPTHVSALKLNELEDLLLYVLDISCTLCAFFDVYPPACKAFHAKGFLTRLADFYDNAVMTLQEELFLRQQADKPDALNKIVAAKSNFLKIYRSVIVFCCTQPILDASNSESTDTLGAHIEDYLDVLITVLENRKFICDLQRKYPIEEDIEMISQTDTELDYTRMQYILEGVMQITGENPTLRSLIDMYSAYSHKPSLTTKPVSKPVSKKAENFSDAWASLGEGACAGPAVSGADLVLLVTQVKDLFPDLGDGFVEACLDYYNFKPEDVINALLEENLPPSLTSLDRNLVKKAVELAPTVVLEEKVEIPGISGSLLTRMNVYDGDEFDVFNANFIDRSKIHKGKKNTLKGSMLDDKSLREKLKNVYESYSIVSDIEYGASGNVYDDEYDDTYDEHGVGASEPDKNEADDMLSLRPVVMPRALASKYNRTRVVEVSSESEEETPGTAARKQDDFCQNPEEIRRRAEERRATQYMNRRGSARKMPPPPNRDVVGKAKGQGQSDNVLKNRTSKEKHKSLQANHNRRNMADRKRSRGMFA